MIKHFLKITWHTWKTRWTIQKEFEPLDKSKKEKIIGEAFHGIVFADEIAMFEVIDPKAEKRNYKELFRYDQIRNYKVYVVENTGEGKNILRLV